MKPVEIYIGTTLRGSARGVGKGMYIMRARLAGDRVYEKMAAVEIDGGYRFSDEITIPLTGDYELTGTGLTLHFAEKTDEVYLNLLQWMTPIHSQQLHQS